MLMAGKRIIPVEIDKAGKKLALKFRFHRPMIDEVKSWRGAEWDKENRRWLVTDCERNQIQLTLLRGETPDALARYSETHPRVEPHRALCMVHQSAMIDLGMGVRRCIWAAEMGTGKSLAAIEVMEHAAEMGFDNWWWVAPAKVLRAIELELAKWKSTVMPRLVSYDKLRKILEQWPKGLPAPHGVIFDESSRIKSPGAQRTKAAMALADAVRIEHDGFVICMTGSPAPKDPCDWWAQAEVACPGYLRESSIVHLRRRLAVIEMVQGPERAYPHLVSWKTDEVEYLKRRLGGLVGVWLSRECLDLPEIRREIVTLPPSPETLRAARLIANTAGTALECLSMLRQLSDGFQYSADDEPTVHVPTPKTEALQHILARYEETGRIIVYAGFRASVSHATQTCLGDGWTVLQCDGRGWALVGMVAEKRTERQRAKPGEKCDSDGWVLGEFTEPEATSFNRPLSEKDANHYLAALDLGTDDGKIEKLAFVAHPKSGGLGLNLTAAPAAVYYSNDFEFESRIQSEKRGHRKGMDVDRGFTIWDLCHLPTDKLILDNLAAKKVLQAITMGDVREALNPGGRK